jgi:hypothetical protein
MEPLIWLDPQPSVQKPASRTVSFSMRRKMVMVSPQLPVEDPWPLVPAGSPR